MIAVFQLFCLNGYQAQTRQIKFNQVELFKQFLGTWKGEKGKDTAFMMETKSFHDAFESYVKTETKGKIIIEEKTLTGYDKKNDKLIESVIINSSPNIILYAMWFTSVHKCEGVLFEDVSNPEKAILKWTFELPSPDILVWTNIKDNKPTNTYIFHREK